MRWSRLLEKELSNLVKTIQELQSNPNLTREAAKEQVAAVHRRLRVLKKKWKEVSESEARALQKCQNRLEHLKTATLDKTSRLSSEALMTEQAKNWHRKRMDRLLSDYLLRQSYFNTARLLIKEAEIENLVDVDVFLRSRRILEELDKKNCELGLKFCADNRSRLRRIKSTLEVNLRLLEFIELIKQDMHMKAVLYARKHLSQFAASHMPKIQRAMACLAYPSDTACAPYQHMFSEDRWQAVKKEFQHDNYLINSLTTVPQLNITLAAGLSALKTAQCYVPEERNPECPVCNEDLNQLARHLPNSHHVRSALRCKITGERIYEDNPLMVLPNGYAYSEKALLDMATKNNDIIICPRTQEKFHKDELVKAFIL